MSVPSTFYKYMSAETAALVLANGKLRWSSPLTFNDIVEFQRMPRFKPSLVEAQPVMVELLADVAYGDAVIEEPRLSPSTTELLALSRIVAATGIPKTEFIASLSRVDPSSDQRMEDTLRSFFDGLDLSKARVFCVTTANDNGAMWGTYADSHAGCVLGFRHIEELSTPLLAATKVTYTQDRPIVGSGLDFLLYGDTKDLRARTVHAVCFSKQLAWSYEDEWRALTWRPEDVGRHFSDFRFYPDELESVTLGARASIGTQRSIVDLVKRQYPDCALYRMTAEHGNLVRHRAEDSR